MKEYKIALKKKKFYELYEAVSTKLLQEYSNVGIKLGKYVKTKIWLIENRNTSPSKFYIRYFLENITRDQKLVNNDTKFDPLYLYRIHRHFDSTKEANEYEVSEWYLSLYTKFLNYDSYKSFLLKESSETLNENSKNEDNTEIEAAVKIVKNFYNHISTNKDFEKAWKLLSKNFQERIWGRYDQKQDTEEEKDTKRLAYFIRGYFFFRTLYNKHIFLPKKIDDHTIECMVYYEAELELPVIDELNYISSATINKIDDFVNNVNKLADIVNKLGGIGFDKRFITRLFHPAPIEFIWFVCEIDPILLRKTYEIKTTIPPISMLFKCKCIKEEGKWVIHGLLPCHC